MLSNHVMLSDWSKGHPSRAGEGAIIRGEEFPAVCHAFEDTFAFAPASISRRPATTR
jgi:hypothetical protein